MKITALAVRNPQTLVLGVGSALMATIVMMLSPLSVSSAAAPLLDVTTTSSKTSLLYTGDTVNYSLQVKNSGTEVATITGINSSLPNLNAACQGLLSTAIQPGESIACSADGVTVSGLPATTFTVKTSVEGAGLDQVKATFDSTNSIDLWWHGRIPGYWKNNINDWSTEFAPNDFLQDVFTIPNALLSEGILDNDSIPGRDTLLSTLTYQGGVTLKGASQILLRAASAALLNEIYFGNDYPGAPSTEYLVARVNVVLASQNKAQYLVLAGYFEKWNNGVRNVVAK
jgi:hypothetical protein